MNLSSDEPIFGKISNQAIWKTMRLVTEYLKMDEVSPYSFRKCSIKRVFKASNYSDEIVYEFLQQNRSAMIDDILTSIAGKARKRYGSNRV